MDAIWASAVAVAGTLLGSLMAHLFQRNAIRRGESFARSEALRQERIETYSGFAAAAEDYRRGQADRWYRRREDPAGDGFRTARDEAHRLRTVARQALYRVRLLTDDRAIVQAAQRAYDGTRDMSLAVGKDDWAVRDAEAKAAIEAFVAHAAKLLR
ncbi:hypothetical protein [Streptomyces sp. RFCAC02]|uniref:hypothetical protein n=1 Tax=Streptomyces sp. RFCAC02 TaxID=2499143 RepID=UPI001020D531|nr:hypothetical protein [Streptomyces sp. RFCAC02]